MPLIIFSYVWDMLLWANKYLNLYIYFPSLSFLELR